MSLINSVFLGGEGSYEIFGVPVKFEKEPNDGFQLPNFDGYGPFSPLLNGIINSYTFRVLTFGYLHVLVHEMGHAITYKLLYNESAEISVFTEKCGGLTTLQNSSKEPISRDWRKTIVSAAGPMADVAFSSLALMAAAALKTHIVWMGTLALGLGALIWMAGEILYAITSACSGYGDFGDIARNGMIHLALASVLLVAQCALGIFASMRIANLSKSF